VKLVFLTQVLDREDAVLGFVVRWLEGLAARCERVRVVALEVGDTRGLPANVDWVEIGRRGTLVRWLRYRRALGQALGREGFDTCLAHMVPRYALLARGPARRHGCALFLWYTHAGVDARLRAAERAVDGIFTVNRASLRLETHKRIETGHGIDLAHFDVGPVPAGPVRLLAVGRRTPAKDPLTLVAALAELQRRGVAVELDLVGGGLAAGDEAYGETLRERIEALGVASRVHLHADVPYRDIPQRYRACTLLVSASRTGSVDKVVLEAMAARRPVVTCNESFDDVLASLGADAAALRFAAGDAQGLADRVQGLLARSETERAQLGERLRDLVARDHEVDALMERLVRRMEVRA
jgi:glycosyltransferase involved in cell wall biosynthesis